MAVKRRLIECECGEIFEDGRHNQLDGNVILGPWRFKTQRVRETKSKSGGDILLSVWERVVECGKCRTELVREKRQYELTPPTDANKPEPIGSYSSRELIVRQPVQEAPMSNTKLKDGEGILRMTKDG